MSGFKEKLAAMDAEWKNTKDQAPGVPDGQYNFQLQNLEMAEASTGSLMVKREHLVLSGEHEGDVVRDQIVLGNPFGNRQLAVFIETMGYQYPDSAEDIEDVLAAILNDAPTYQAKVKKQKDNDFRNVTVIKLIEAEAPTAAPAAAPKAAPVKAKAPVATPAKTTVKPAQSTDPVLAKDMTVSYKEGETEFASCTITEVKDGGAVVIDTGDGNLYEVEGKYCTVIEATEAAAEATEEPAAEEAKDTSALIAFGQAHEIEVAEDETYEALVEKLTQYEYKKEELTPEEVELLEGIGATFAASKPKPAPKPAAVKPTPAPAKATTPAKAVTKPTPTPVKATPKPALAKKK